MHGLVHHLFRLFIHLGAFGPLILGILDSSFLFLPVGNDLLLLVLVARHHENVLIYVLAASLGSTAGVVLLDLVSRKGGEEGLQKMMKPKRFDYFKKKMRQRAAVPLAIACLAPPPFPFTPVIAAAGAFQYPRVRLLLVVFAFRTARFLLIGVAALLFGSRILVIVRSSEFTWFMIGFVVVCLVGSTISVISWVQRSRAK